MNVSCRTKQERRGRNHEDWHYTFKTPEAQQNQRDAEDAPRIRSLYYGLSFTVLMRGNMGVRKPKMMSRPRPEFDPEVAQKTGRNEKCMGIYVEDQEEAGFTVRYLAKTWWRRRWIQGQWQETSFVAV
jgi:hypothetical protein